MTRVGFDPMTLLLTSLKHASLWAELHFIVPS